MDKGIRQHALNGGIKLARQVFEKRGNHTEAHLSETELAAICALAYERALESKSKHTKDAT